MIKKSLPKITIPLLITALILPLVTHFSAGKTDSAASSAFKGKKLHIYRQAARQYWQKRVTIPESTCPPERVTIWHTRYEPAIVGATAYVGAAWPALTPTPMGVFNYPSSDFCTTRVNRNNLEDSRSACITFIHEYGHILGFQHNNFDINDVMYQGYTEIDDENEYINVANRWQAIVLSRSICRRIKEGT